MNTYTISKDKFKICLTDDEINSLFGGYDKIDYDCPRSRAVLDSLLCSTLPESMLPFDCKRVLIEVMQERTGCSIQITRICEKGKRLHKVCGKHKYILLFDSSEDLIKFVSHTDNEQLKTLKNTKLMEVGSHLALCFTSNTKITDSEGILYNEYGRIFDMRSLNAAAILEYGNTICNEALEKLILSFKK